MPLHWLHKASAIFGLILDEPIIARKMEILSKAGILVWHFQSLTTFGYYVTSLLTVVYSLEVTSIGLEYSVFL